MSATQNCGYMVILFSKGMETEVSNYFEKESLLCSIRLKSPGDNRKMEMTVSDEITNGIPGTTVAVTNKYDAVFGGRYVMETISMAIIGGMVVLLIVLTVFIVSSNIALYISDHKSMFGILEAIGYTSHDMILSVVPAVILLVFFVTVLGIAASYLFFPAFQSYFGNSDRYALSGTFYFTSSVNYYWYVAFQCFIFGISVHAETS